MLFYFTTILVFVLDQIFKFLVHNFMHLGQSIPLLGNIVSLTYVRNTGAAFSLFIGFSPYLIVVGVLVVLAVLYFHYRLPSKPIFLQFGLACVLGGSLGNLADRIFRGYVVDYLDITLWPVFNLADIMINIGVILIAYKMLSAEAQDKH
jgi:signal peptidase II